MIHYSSRVDSVLWYVLPLAIAVALSIFPVLAAVLLLLSPDSLKSSIGYGCGWLLGIIGLVTAFAVSASLIPQGVSGSLPSWVHYVEIVVGAYLVFRGIVTAVREQRREKTVEPPRWLQAASNLSAPGHSSSVCS